MKQLDMIWGGGYDTNDCGLWRWFNKGSNDMIGFVCMRVSRVVAI